VHLRDGAVGADIDADPDADSYPAARRSGWGPHSELRQSGDVGVQRVLLVPAAREPVTRAVRGCFFVPGIRAIVPRWRRLP